MLDTPPQISTHPAPHTNSSLSHQEPQNIVDVSDHNSHTPMNSLHAVKKQLFADCLVVILLVFTLFRIRLGLLESLVHIQEHCLTLPLPRYRWAVPRPRPPRLGQVAVTKVKMN